MYGGSKEFVILDVSREIYSRFQKELPDLINSIKIAMDYNKKPRIVLNYNPLEREVIISIINSPKRIPIRGWQDQKKISRKDFDLIRMISFGLKGKIHSLNE